MVVTSEALMNMQIILPLLWTSDLEPTSVTDTFIVVTNDAVQPSIFFSMVSRTSTFSVASDWYPLRTNNVWITHIILL